MVAMQVALCIYNGPSFADVFEPDATGLNAAFKTVKMKVRLSEIIKGIVLPKLLLAMGC